MIYSEPLFSKSPQIGNHDGFMGMVPFAKCNFEGDGKG